MTRNSKMVVFIIVLAMLLGCAFIVLKNREPHQFNPNTAVVAMNASESNETNQKNRKLIEGKKFLSNLANSSSTEHEQDGYEDELAEFQLTDVERAQKAIIASKISPVFMSLAPNVLDKIIGEQELNDAWTRDTFEELTAKLNNERYKNTEVEEVGCYSSMCKIVIDYDSQETLNSFFPAATMDGNLFGPSHVFNKKQPDSSIKSTIYLGRPQQDRMIHDYLYERMYEEITGTPANSIEPTKEQIEEVAAGY